MMDDLARIRQGWNEYPEEAVGLQIGELDQLSELHRILHKET